MQLPTSGVILGHVVRALELNRAGSAGASFLKDRTFQRYFEGKEGPKFESRSDAIRTIVRCLVDEGLLPEPMNPFAPPDWSAQAAMAYAFEDSLRNWDGVVGELGSAPIRIVDRPAAVVAVLELLLADFSVRWAALCLLEERPAPDEAGTPAWARENAQRDLLRSLLERGGLTRDAFVEATGAGFSTVDAWLDGTHRPSHEGVRSIASSLAPVLGSTAATLGRDLRRQLSLVALSQELEVLIGRSQLERITAALVRLTRRAWSALNALPSSERYDETVSTFSGGLISVKDDVLHAVRQGEEDEDVAHAVALAQHHLSVALYLRWAAYSTGNGPRRVRHRGLELATVRRDHRATLAILRELLAKEPFDFDLLACRAGTYLEVGNYDAAIQDAHLAAALHPGDEGYILVASTLSLANCDAQGLAYLEEKLEVLSDPSWRLRYQLGCLHYELQDFPAAAKRFQEVLALKPDHAYAASYLAIAAERSGDRARANSAEKRSRHFGHRMAHEWLRGWRQRGKP